MHIQNIPPSPTGTVFRRQGSRHSSPIVRNHPARFGRSRQVAALLVMPPQRGTLFQQVLNELGVAISCVDCCRAARELLQAPNSLGLVVTHASLPDGNWCDMLRMMTDLEAHASLVVDAPEVNQTLWSEVFWRGAYDLLVQPCDWNDVRQCFEGALRSRPASSPFVARPAA